MNLKVIPAFIVLLSVVSAQNTMCENIAWDCTDNEATLQGSALNAAVPALFGIRRSLNAKFIQEEDIRSVKIATDINIEIKSIEGPQVTSIEISGRNKVIETICPFLDRDRMPELNRVWIHDAQIHGFSDYQYCGNNTLFKRLLDVNFPNNGVEIIIENTTIHLKPRSDEQDFIIFEQDVRLSKLILSHVKFMGTRDLFFLDANKLEGTDVSFEKSNNCLCSNSADGSWKCENTACEMTSDDNLDNIASSAPKGTALVTVWVALVLIGTTV